MNLRRAMLAAFAIALAVAEPGSVPRQAQAVPSQPSSDRNCAPEGRTCTFGSDCCSGHCVHDPKLGRVCKTAGASWTCKPEGTSCTFGRDCCSKTCVNDPRLGKVCKPDGASWTCAPQGRACTFGSDCCSKRCVEDPKLGKICKPQPSR
jgi:hypothetical protein